MKNINKLEGLKDKITKKEEQILKYQEQIEKDKQKLKNEEKNILYKHFKKQKMTMKEYIEILNDLFSNNVKKEENKSNIKTESGILEEEKNELFFEDNEKVENK